MSSADVKHGIYRHYKGRFYQVFGVAHDANYDEFHSASWDQPDPLFDDGRTVVVYIGLELDEAHLGPRLAVRTLSDFLGWVHPDGRTKEGPITTVMGGDDLREEGWKPRFEYLGPELTGDMLVT